MKEATGELSTTAIAIVAIAAILAIFTTLLLPMLRRQIAVTQACNSGPGYSSENVKCTGLGSTDSGLPNNKICNPDEKDTSKQYACGYKDSEDK